MNFFGITLLQPLLFLVLLPAGLLTFVAYKRRSRRPPITINSSFIVKKFTSSMTTRPKAPKRFLFELLILLILSLLLTHPNLEKTGDLRAVLIDDSLSMSARYGNSTAYEEALAQAKAESTSSDDIYLTSKQGPLLPGDLPRKASHTSDNLSNRVKELLNTGKYAEIVVYTDKDSSRGSPENIRQVVLKPAIELGNMAISKAILDPDEGIIKVTVENFSVTKNKATLFLHSSTTKNLKNLNIEIEANSKDTFFIAAAPQNALYLELQAPKAEDAIEADNFFYVAEGSLKKLIGVKSPEPFESLGLDKIDLLDFKELKPGIEYDGYLYHYERPESEPDKSTVFLNSAPPAIELNKSNSATYANPIKPGHPLVRYLKFSTLAPYPFNTFKFPSSAVSLVESENGPILGTVSTPTKRFTLCGIELLPFRGKASAFSSILFLNLLKWTFLDEMNPGGVKHITIKNGENARFFSSDSSEALQSGKHTILKSGLILGSRKIIALNFFDEQESDTLRKQYFSIPEMNQDDKNTGRSENNKLITLLLYVIMGILTTDLFVFYFLL